MHLGLFEDELSAARAYEAAVATQRPYVPASAERSRATEQAPPAVPAGTLQEAWYGTFWHLLVHLDCQTLRIELQSARLSVQQQC